MTTSSMTSSFSASSASSVSSSTSSAAFTGAIGARSRTVGPTLRRIGNSLSAPLRWLRRKTSTKEVTSCASRLSLDSTDEEDAEEEEDGIYLANCHCLPFLSQPSTFFTCRINEFDQQLFWCPHDEDDCLVCCPSESVPFPMASPEKQVTSRFQTVLVRFKKSLAH